MFDKIVSFVIFLSFSGLFLFGIYVWFCLCIKICDGYDFLCICLKSVILHIKDLRKIKKGSVKILGRKL